MWYARFQQNLLPVPWAAPADRPVRPLLWTARLALGAVLAVPLLILAAAAFLIGLFLFRALRVILGLVTLPLRLWSLAAARSVDSGRRNVRVIEPDRQDGDL